LFATFQSFNNLIVIAVIRSVYQVMVTALGQ